MGDFSEIHWFSRAYESAKVVIKAKSACSTAKLLTGTSISPNMRIKPIKKTLGFYNAEILGQLLGYSNVWWD
jgi:hypothetical protein